MLQSNSLSHRPRMLQVRRYMPYGSGSRECLGMPQARVTMLATLAVMLSRFSFGAADQVSTFIHSFITRFPIRRLGALQHIMNGSPPTCPVLGFLPPCI